MTSVVGTTVFDAMAEQAIAESPLWGDQLLPPERRDAEPVFSPLAAAGQALGLETAYEGYLVHFGRSRLFAPTASDTALLLGDYLYAHGLVHIAATGDAAAVADLAELISLAAQMRADGADGDGAAWAATAALLGAGVLADARVALRDHADPEPLLRAAREAVGADALGRALAAHARYSAASSV